MSEVNSTGKKPLITYPCEWSYKVIGMDEKQIRGAIAIAVKDRRHKITLSKSSKTGKYTSLNLDLTVKDEAERTTLYERLKNHAHVKIVM